MTQVYQVAHKTLLDNYAVLETLTPNEVYVGASIIVAGVDATFNGTVTVLAVPEYLFIGVDEYGDLVFNEQAPVPFQILYAKTADNVTRTIATGTVTLGTVPCTWITAGQIEDWLGIGTASALDTTFLTQCASASNAFCFQRRLESGYIDAKGTSPSDAVTLGTIAYGGFLYRQRGAVTDFASFDGLPAGNSVGLSPMIKQLLGIPRPQVA
ncbi:hypothetical protein UFOVP866_8 [uncultured Caudovirales phage]|uniref:Gp6 domain containing protein n=1 Tax=uncultured Caudovirales phage TaxID=2100421 RepID=A0A6J5P6L4_9CAUD|nr:hypothetical protein UFOVP866_8 [uncultured Caudovirales phage]CAB4222037.1 hypothetical protein UFOVP1653_8 [uncultured Caudovirales phage]